MILPFLQVCLLREKYKKNKQLRVGKTRFQNRTPGLPNPQTPGMPSSSRQPDDSHKYPLRSGGGAGLSSAAPPFLAAADDDTATGTVEVNGDINGKLKGYEGHMAALGKLGAGSPSARLFPTPGKKLLKAVGQAIQVCWLLAGHVRLFQHVSRRVWEDLSLWPFLLFCTVFLVG